MAGLLSGASPFDGVLMGDEFGVRFSEDEA